MFSFSYPAKFKAGSDGRVMVEFVDLAHVATDGQDDREAMVEAMDALAPISPSACHAGNRFQRPHPQSVVSAWCPCRSGWRRNSRSTWPCAISASPTPNWHVAWDSTSG